MVRCRGLLLFLWLWVWVWVGCGFSNTVGGGPGDAKVIDAAIDVPPDAFDPLCFAGGAFYFCLPTLPTGARTVPTVIDTSRCNGPGEQVHAIGDTAVCTIAGDTVTVPSGDIVYVTGSRPLVLVAVTNLTIEGAIDASSILASSGPGADPSTCTPANGTANVTAGGGGAGGSFTTPGGNGGTGDGGGVAGGVAAGAMATSQVLRGGCPGGTGPVPPAGATTVPGGPGGGAVMLVSRETMVIDGYVDVSGAGGAGGMTAKGGGGGGGSGGMLVLHAGTLMVTSNARINANGGGGGGGAGNLTNGEAGANPNAALPMNVAPGGQSTTQGRSAGGNGAAAAMNATAGMAGANGGGGGGGGHGLVRVLGDSPTFPANTVSPTPVN